MATTGAASSFGIIGKLFGNAVSSAVGFGAGVALGPVLEPPVRALRNTINSSHAYVFPDAGLLANGVAQGQIDPDTAGRWASYSGVGDKAFAALVNIANTGPGVPIAFDLWRRNVIDEAGFRRAVKRQGLEPEWINDLVKVKRRMLDPADLARGIHRGLIPDPGLLQGTLPSGVGHVPAYPVYPIDALAEAAAAGFEKDDLGVLVGLQGLPMGSHEAAQAFFRGVLTENDYLRAIAEGNTRNEWAEAILEQSRQIPTVHEYVENYLRGYSDEAAMIAGAARHGMTPDDVKVIFQNAGRPLNIHQITTGLARGGKYQPIPGELKDPYEAASHESNLKPSYYDLNEANKYTMPSVLAIRQLAQSGTWDAAKTETRLLWSGWYPPDAKEVAEEWTKGGSGGSKEATAADLVTLYEGEQATRADTLTALEALGYPADEAGRKLDLIDARRITSAKTATVTKLAASFFKSELTADACRTAITQLGYSSDTAANMVAAWGVYLAAFPPAAPTPPPAA